MGLGLFFWIVYLIWIIFWGWSNRATWRSSGPDLIVAILLAVLAWRVFGPPLHD